MHGFNDNNLKLHSEAKQQPVSSQSVNLPHFHILHQLKLPNDPYLSCLFLLPCLQLFISSSHLSPSPFLFSFLSPSLPEIIRIIISLPPLLSVLPCHSVIIFLPFLPRISAGFPIYFAHRKLSMRKSRGKPAGSSS